MKNAFDDIKRLEDKISELKKQEDVLGRKIKSKSEFVRASRIGLRIGVELFSAVIVGAGIGHLLDGFFDTKNWLLIVFLFFGCAAGILNVYRLSQKENDINNYKE